jgi:hypothetical protein
MLRGEVFKFSDFLRKTLTFPRPGNRRCIMQPLGADVAMIDKYLKYQLNN